MTPTQPRPLPPARLAQLQAYRDRLPLMDAPLSDPRWVAMVAVLEKVAARLDAEEAALAVIKRAGERE